MNNKTEKLYEAIGLLDDKIAIANRHLTPESQAPLDLSATQAPPVRRVRFMSMQFAGLAAAMLLLAIGTVAMLRVLAPQDVAELPVAAEGDSTTEEHDDSEAATTPPESPTQPPVNTSDHHGGTLTYDTEVDAPDDTRDAILVSDATGTYYAIPLPMPEPVDSDPPPSGHATEPTPTFSAPPMTVEPVPAIPGGVDTSGLPEVLLNLTQDELLELGRAVLGRDRGTYTTFSDEERFLINDFYFLDNFGVAYLVSEQWVFGGTANSREQAMQRIMDGHTATATIDYIGTNDLYYSFRVRHEHGISRYIMYHDSFISWYYWPQSHIAVKDTNDANMVRRFLDIRLLERLGSSTVLHRELESHSYGGYTYTWYVLESMDSRNTNMVAVRKYSWHVSATGRISSIQEYRWGWNVNIS
jgi:hypothetical protein